MPVWPWPDRSRTGHIKFTNLDWEVEEGLLAQATGASSARLINDYAGLAFALPHLEEGDTKTSAR